MCIRDSSRSGWGSDVQLHTHKEHHLQAHQLVLSAHWAAEDQRRASAVHEILLDNALQQQFTSKAGLPEAWQSPQLATGDDSVINH